MIGNKKIKTNIYRIQVYDSIMCGQLLILISIVTGSVSIPAFVSLVGIPIAMRSSEIGLKICVTEGIKK